MAAALAVFSFAAPALAGVSAVCAPSEGPRGTLVNCDITGTGPDLDGNIDLRFSTNCDPPDQGTFCTTVGGTCSGSFDSADFPAPELGAHDYTFYGTNSTTCSSIQTFDITEPPPPPPPPEGPQFSPAAGNAALETAVQGGLDLLWDNLGNILLIVASVGIVAALFWWIYSTLKHRK